MSPERAAAKLRNPSVEPACFRLCCSEVEQKWLCLHKPSGLHGFYIPKQLAATLMRTTEGLLWQLMLFGRMESGRRMWCSGVCRPDGTSVHGMFGLRYFPPPPIVYISFKISLSGVVNDGHESPRLFSKQYIISDAMMCSLYFHTSRVEQNIKGNLPALGYKSLFHSELPESWNQKCKKINAQKELPSHSTSKISHATR